MAGGPRRDRNSGCCDEGEVLFFPSGVSDCSPVEATSIGSDSSSLEAFSGVKSWVGGESTFWLFSVAGDGVEVRGVETDSSLSSEFKPSAGFCPLFVVDEDSEEGSVPDELLAELSRPEEESSAAFVGGVDALSVVSSDASESPDLDDLEGDFLAVSDDGRGSLEVFGGDEEAGARDELVSSEVGTFVVLFSEPDFLLLVVEPELAEAVAADDDGGAADGVDVVLEDLEVAELGEREERFVPSADDVEEVVLCLVPLGVDVAVASVLGGVFVVAVSGRVGDRLPGFGGVWDVDADNRREPRASLTFLTFPSSRPRDVTKCMSWVIGP